MASFSSRLGGLVRDSLTTLLVLVFLAALAEGLFRVLQDVVQEPTAPATTAPVEEDLALPPLHHPEELSLPGIRGLNAGALFETNRDGFRGPARTREKPPGVTRVAIIGDSTAMGWGVAEEDTYAARLEPLLVSDELPHGVEVLNFALAGLTAEGVLRRLEELALDFDPDIVVYGYSLNDIAGPRYRHSLDRDYARSLFQNDSPSHLWRWLRPRWLAFQEVIFAPRGTFAFELDENYFRNPEALDEVRTRMERLAELGRLHDFCGVVLVHTQMQALHALHPYERHYRVIEELAQQAGLTSIDSLDRFREESARELWVNPNDRHANARGHAIYAALLADGLTDLPQACWPASD